MSDGRFDYMKQFLEEQEKKGRLRTLREVDSGGTGARVFSEGRLLIDLSSNDYLGLKNHPALLEAAAQEASRWGIGSGASRLISGTAPIHTRLEKALAGFHGFESALLFSSGYAAGVGVIPALVSRGEHLYLDRLCHASLYDGARLSGAKLNRYHHCEPGHLEHLLKKDNGSKGRKLVVTDSVFSMDGDCAPLKELAALCEKYNAILLVDEAHSTGVLGPEGRGLLAREEIGTEGVILMGTLGKAFGVMGAYVAAEKTVTEYLVNACRSFIYTTAMSPLIAAGVEKSLEIIQSDDGEALRSRLSSLSERFREFARESGMDCGASSTQIIPLIVGGDSAALEFSAKLLASGVLAPAVRPPTVPEGSARIRFSLSAALGDDDLDFVLRAISACRT